MLNGKIFFQKYSIVLFSLLMLLSAGNFNGQNNISAESILSDYVKAIGGKEKISDVEDLAIYMSGKIKSINIKYQIFKKVPNKFLQIVKLNDDEQKTIFDGKNGKVYSVNQVENLSGDRLEILKVRAIMFPEVEYEKYGIVPELIGRIILNNRPAFKIKLNKTGIKNWFMFFDEETGLKQKEELTVITAKGEFVQTTGFKNYKTVNGIKLPARIIQSFNGTKIDLQVTKVDINSRLNDNIFSAGD